MTIKSITYSASIKELIFKSPMQLKTSNSSITKIEIKMESEEWLVVSFFLENVFSECEAISITEDMARILTNRISFKYGCRVGQPRLKCIMGDRDDCLYDYVNISDNIISSTISIGDTGQKDLQQYLETPYSNVDRYLTTYCFIMKQDEPVSRFLLLYGFLTLIEGEQKKIDTLILKIDSSVPTSSSPKLNSTQKETLFTRLRNEMMHPNDRKVDLANIEQEMRSSVDWLQDITKRHLQSIT